MLGIRNPLKAADIYKISELAKGHPVYKVEGWGDERTGRVDTIVLKVESGHGPAVQVAAHVMSMVDQRSAQIALNAAELAELKKWATGAEVPDVETFRAAQAIAQTLNQPGTWLKMELRNLMTLDDAVTKRLDPANPDKADVRVIAHALRKHGGLEKLGEIIAADLFNGSNDRFAYPALAAAQPGKHGIPLKVVQNVGNVFIACDGNGRGSPIGLDNFDPFGAARHVDGPQAQGMDLSLGQWGGNLLVKANKADRDEFVAAVIEDMEALLGGGSRNRKNPFGTQNRLGTGRKQRLTNGLASGAKKLEAGFKKARANAQGRKLHDGLLRKLAQLGW